MELSPIILRNFLYFRKRSFVIFQGTGTTKSSYISESNFPSSKKKQKQKKKKKTKKKKKKKNKSTTRKFFILHETETLTKTQIFSQKKAYILGNGNL